MSFNNFPLKRFLNICVSYFLFLDIQGFLKNSYFLHFFSKTKKFTYLFSDWAEERDKSPRWHYSDKGEGYFRTESECQEYWEIQVCAQS